MGKQARLARRGCKARTASRVPWGGLGPTGPTGEASCPPYLPASLSLMSAALARCTALQARLCTLRPTVTASACLSVRQPMRVFPRRSRQTAMNPCSHLQRLMQRGVVPFVLRRDAAPWPAPVWMSPLRTSRACHPATLRAWWADARARLTLVVGGASRSGGANQPWGPAAWQRWRERGSWPGASGVGDWLWDGVQVATTAPVISLKGTGVAASTGGETLGGKTLPRKALSTLMRKLDADAETMQKLEPSIAKRLLTPAHLHARARSGGATPQRNTAMGSTARRISTVPTVPTVKVAGGLADVVEKTALARRRERRAVLKPTKAGKEVRSSP